MKKSPPLYEHYHFPDFPQNLGGGGESEVKSCSINNGRHGNLMASSQSIKTFVIIGKTTSE